jgi:anaerobic sulfite reductase subunit B
MNGKSNIYLPKQHKILKVWNETETIKTFRVNHKISHEPGQFLEVSIFNFGEAPISISSYSKEYVDLTIRRVGRVTNALHRLKEGDFLGLRGPYGRGYPMEEMKGKGIIIVGGGCGVSPLRSVVQYIEKFQKNYNEIDLFLGYRSPSEIMFKKDMKQWMKKFNVHLTVDIPDKNWQYEVGVITKLLEKEEINPKDKFVLTCGPPVMIKFVIKTLKERKNFKDEQIYISLERRMKCGFGKCGHCMINDKYVCLDGPVFNYAEGKLLED